MNNKANEVCRNQGNSRKQFFGETLQTLKEMFTSVLQSHFSAMKDLEMERDMLVGFISNKKTELEA